MNIANLYRKIKLILDDSNAELENKGLNSVGSLSEIVSEIKKLGSINRLPYIFRKEILEISADELNSVTIINESAFHDCINLTSITIPDSVTLIGDNAFVYCTSLPSITIPDSVISIGYRAFAECNNLTSITIGNSVTTIGSQAFYRCYYLPSITIPDSVTTIGGWAFYGCNSLTDIYLHSTTPPSLGDASAIPTHTTIHVPIGSGDAYKSATNWSYRSDRIVEDIIIE